MAGKKNRGGAFAALSLRPAPKGREVDPAALDQIITLLGNEPRRRDLLIEHLHKIQDRYGCVSAAHMNALAYEMRMTMAEVYEVATFYHHFDIVKDDEAMPAPITVRICDSISCHLAGSERLLEELHDMFGDDVRVMAAPCIGQCDSAPAAFVGKRVHRCATVDGIVRGIELRDTEPEIPAYTDYAAYRANGGYGVY